MRVARLHGPRDLRLDEEPVPAPGPDTSLVRVTAVGLCGSDLHWYTEGGIGDAKLDHPLVVGHEFAGVVEGGPHHGLRVAVDPAISCRTCVTCQAGHPNLCPSVIFAGHARQDGGLREFVTWPTALLHPLPDSLTDIEGAMLEPLGVALHAVDLGHLRVAGTAAVIGCGPIGLLVLQVAQLAGAEVIAAVDPLPHRLEVARRLGAQQVLTPDARHAWPSVAGDGVDVAFEAAGTDDAIEQSMLATRPGGRVVLAGIPDGDRSSFPAGLARRKGLTILLSRRMKDVYPRATSLAERRLVDLTNLVTARYPLERVTEAFEAASARQGVKVIVEMRSGSGPPTLPS